MIKKIKVALMTLIIIGVFMLSPIHSDSLCTDNMSLEQCYNYLNQRAQELERQSRQLSANISQERYNQMTLAQQIEYMTAKISDTEIQIQRIEIELESKNVEIRMLQRDIDTKQNNIATISQETNVLKNSIAKRVAISYKYSFLSPLEFFVKAESADKIFRKLKYLNETRKNDREILQEMIEHNQKLEAVTSLLEKHQLDLEKTRIGVEEMKSELFREKENLATQQSTHANLLAISKDREASYQDNLAQVKTAQNSVTEQITAIIRQMYERGQIALDRRVSRGEIIGFQGYTGFSYGSHLHLAVWNPSGALVDPFSAGYLSGGALQGGVGAGTYHQPLAGGILTQRFHAGHRAIDLVSTTHGEQPGSTYYGGPLSCYGMSRRPGWYSTRGTGAPVYALTDGHVSGMLVDACGGKYVVLKHDDGGTSLYLHLQ